MHGATRMIVNVQQAKFNNNYKNTRLKLLKANAAIWFNKMCKVKQLKPNYINIKINGHKPQDKKTTINAIRFRINQEIKFLYRKKQHLKERMYYLHLESAHQYNGMWQHIQCKCICWLIIKVILRNARCNKNDSLLMFRNLLFIIAVSACI